MDLTKRIFIEKDPAYEDVRQRASKAAAAYCASFTFRVAGNRRNAMGGRPHWDPFWPGALAEAATTIGARSVNINGGVFFETEVERDAVLVLAEIRWRERLAAYAARLAKR